MFAAPVETFIREQIDGNIPDVFLSPKKRIDQGFLSAAYFGLETVDVLLRNTFVVGNTQKGISSYFYH